MNESLKRVLTSLLSVPILIFSVFYPFHNTFVLFFAIMLFAAILMGKELLFIITTKKIGAYKSITLATIILTITTIYLLSLDNSMLTGFLLSIFKDGTLLNYASVFILFTLLSTAIIFLRESLKHEFTKTIETVSAHIFIVLYSSIGIVFILKIQSLNPWHFFFILIVTWATDSGAYFVGKYLGKTKLNLKASPNKTLEGFIGGIITGIIFALLLKWIFPDIYSDKLSLLYSYPYLIAISFIFTILTILGDLAESLLKRSSGIKDTNTYIPGHGGMLDVMDSLIYNAPLFYFLLNLSIL